MKGGSQDKKGNPLDNIKIIEQKREERRIKMEDLKKEKQEKKAYNLASGKNVDIDFQIMIDKNRFREKMLSPHVFSSQNKLTVCVRKRPVFKKQQQGGEIDSISCANPQIKVHEPKYKVDGITKYVENHTFTFDNTFNEAEETSQIYKVSLKPLLNLLTNNGVVTCFAYGQTGSGKTYTMNQMQLYLVEQLFLILKGHGPEVNVSFFEIYAGRCLDLLNDKNNLNIMQDKNNNIQIQGIVQKNASSAKELLQIMDYANKSRTTHSTAANDTSSRSHSICQILIRKNGSDIGKLVLVDLAGSQRAQDTQSNNRQRRMQGAQINKSLLALKECIRAMGDKADHVPFRASKLTLILRDSFINKQNKSKVVMIACISPGSSSADHSLNTLRYADRLKDNSQMHKMLNQMYDKKTEETDIQNQFSKQHIQKIQSLKNIKNDKPIQNNKSVPVPDKKVLPPPPPQNNSGVNQKKKEQIKKQEPKKEKGENNNRSGSNKKQPNLPLINKAIEQKKPIKSNRISSEKQNEERIEEQLQEQVHAKVDHVDKKKIKEDVNFMKSTLKNQNMGEQYFAFQEKVTNILEQQQQVFATHMASIKEDAKLLTQESELISKVQGVGYVDFDIDSYVEKLQTVVKKKLKMYNLLSKKIEHFKKCLSEEEQIRHNVKDTFYF